MYQRSVAGQSALLTVMIRAVQAAGRKLSRDFEEVQHLQVSQSGTRRFVSIAEKKAADVLKKDLMKVRPDYGMLIEGEAEIESQDGEHRWIVDPLDGTSNFAHGIPFFTVSVAVEKEGEIIAGVIYDVVHDELFFAEKGFGCYVNGKRLRVSGRNRLDQALLCSHMHIKGTIDNRLKDFQKRLETISPIAPHMATTRIFGSLSLDLAYVASGRSDLVVLDSFNLWDVAAGFILIKEAGGYATGFDGKHIPTPKDALICGNPDLHKQVLKVFK